MMSNSQEWDYIPLGKACLIRTGKKDVNEGNPMGEYPFFTCSRMNTFCDNYSFDTEAILIAGNGEVGNLHKYKGKFEAYQRTYVLDGFSLNIDYVYQYVSAYLKDKLKRSHIGSTIPFIKHSDLSDFLIYHPILSIQQTKIAEIIETFDNTIKQTEALIAKQQRIKTGLMQDLLTKGMDEQGIIRSEETHEFKDSPLGRIPVEWEAVIISSVLLEPPKNGYSPIESNNWNGIYMLGLGCLTSNGFKPKQLKYAPENDKKIKGSILKDGDFLISRANTRDLVGMVGIYKDIGEVCVFPDLMVRLKFVADVSPRYMQQIFMSSVIRRQIENAATGTSSSMVKISAAIIKALIFKKPHIEEQLKILDVLETYDNEIQKLKIVLYKFTLLKTALMQDLLTGKVRVTPLLKETEVNIDENR